MHQDELAGERRHPSALSTCRWAAAMVAANLRGAMEYRSAFFLQAAFMLLNNVIFLAFWAVFFTRVPDVAGWQLTDVAGLYAITASGFGLAVIVAGGCLDTASRVATGRLDAWLLRPRSVVLQACL